MWNGYITQIKKIDCLTSNSEYTFAHAELRTIELDENKVGDSCIFEINGPQKRYIVIRLDTIESLLRRGNPGIILTEIPSRNLEMQESGREA